MKGKFLGQGFVIPTNTEVEYDLVFSDNEQLAIIWSLDRQKLYYILPCHFVIPIDEIGELTP